MIDAIVIGIALIWSFIATFGFQPLVQLKEGVFKSPTPVQQEVQVEKPASNNQTNQPIKTGNTNSQVTPKIQQPTLGTYVKITAGPYDGEIIPETNEVTFEFDLKKAINQDIIFETKIIGFDNDWIATNSKQRTIILPAGPKEYTFYVRQQNKANQSPAQRKFKINVSPYFQKLDISSLSTQDQNQPSLITINSSLNTEEQINITGWSIENVRDKIIFPKGIEKYNPDSNYTPKDNVIIRQGDTIYISSAQTPIGPTQIFKINKCFGYLNDLYTFPISVYRNCPSVDQKDISHLSDCCQEYILSAPTCDIQKDVYKVEESDCKTYIANNFSYQGCFIKHSQDSDFLDNQWQVYLNRNLAITGECNTIYLRDQNGLFVDKYAYNQDSCRY
jgi:hypothetical protein